MATCMGKMFENYELQGDDPSTYDKNVEVIDFGNGLVEKRENFRDLSSDTRVNRLLAENARRGGLFMVPPEVEVFDTLDYDSLAGNYRQQPMDAQEIVQPQFNQRVVRPQYNQQQIISSQYNQQQTIRPQYNQQQTIRPQYNQQQVIGQQYNQQQVIGQQYNQQQTIKPQYNP